MIEIEYTLCDNRAYVDIVYMYNMLRLVSTEFFEIRLFQGYTFFRVLSNHFLCIYPSVL